MALDPLRDLLRGHETIWFENFRKEVNDALAKKLVLVSVDDIDTPTELSGYEGSEAGVLLVAYTDTYYTLYAWDDLAVDDSPYVVSGWVAIAGRHVNAEPRINALTASRMLGSDANKGLASILLTSFLAGTAGRLTFTATAGGGATGDVVESGLDHNLLANLTVGNPHTQYGLVADNEFLLFFYAGF